MLIEHGNDRFTANWELPRFRINEFGPRRTKYCVLMCVWNEGERFTAQLDRMQPFLRWADVLVADSNSTDGSTQPSVIQPRGVRSLLSTEERGVSTALRMGYAYSLAEGYEGVITVDGNGKDGVEAIPRFVEALDSGFEFVQGSRFIMGGEYKHTPWDRIVGPKMISAPLMRLSGKWYSDVHNGFRAVNRKLLLNPAVQPFRRVFNRYNLLFYLNYQAARLNVRLMELPVRRNYPAKGPTPTKCTGMVSRLSIIWELVNTVVGRYNPTDFVSHPYPMSFLLGESESV